ncbi:MAG: bifunctional folylpolyglutamate synthase/dihydrofolate synthase, partial [Bacteroidales bacterium]|nr:bifunctional folylpolyglutamate synthase/dihydrofolate synthase [Bacteroidales bacterium]
MKTTYEETLDFLFNSLPAYHRIGAAAYKADLSNTEAMMQHLGHPERGFRSIHVAGTNGKGSVSHFLASILQEAGYKVGLYTSPHLVDFRERIRINGEMIPKEAVTDFVDANHTFFVEQQLSFFEMTVGLAFDYFRNEKVDIAVIEVGMGGRLDSTNVITPLLSVITNIGLDHTQFLGDTLEKIAAEKAGIIKLGVPVVIGQTQPE